MLVDAVHPALEDREKAINGVGVALRLPSVDVLAASMIDSGVAGERLAEWAIEHGFVDHQPRLMRQLGR